MPKNIGFGMAYCFWIFHSNSELNSNIAPRLVPMEAN